MQPSESQHQSTRLPVPVVSGRIIKAQDLRDLCGGISDMTLWRWLNDQSLDFPRPIYLGRRRYWRETEVLAWLDAREVAA
ncbi:helix-turn-helix transcriptional regulator [Pararhodobacter aggregans]